MTATKKPNRSVSVSHFLVTPLFPAEIKYKISNMLSQQSEQHKTMLAKIAKQIRKNKKKGGMNGVGNNLNNKEDRLNQSQNNLALLKEAFDLQNKKEALDEADLDAKVVFKKKKKK